MDTAHNRVGALAPPPALPPAGEEEQQRTPRLFGEQVILRARALAARDAA
jgi:hypothetical protein